MNVQKLIEENREMIQSADDDMPADVGYAIADNFRKIDEYLSAGGELPEAWKNAKPAK